MTEDKVRKITYALSGKCIYGDDFSEAEIEQWLRDEKEAFTDLYIRGTGYRYEYHALNRWHGYRYLPDKRYRKVLGLGSATGEEFHPIIKNIDELVIVEPSDYYSHKREVEGVPATYIQPRSMGNLQYPDSEFDLVNIMGVLHHIPNVSNVLRECARCLEDGGWMIIREPIISMGNWESIRLGLTKRERGIPINRMREKLSEYGLDCVHWSPWGFAPLTRLARALQMNVYNHGALVKIDALLSRAFFWNYKYHATKVWEKFRPSAAFYVATKRG